MLKLASVIALTIQMVIGVLPLTVKRLSLIVKSRQSVLPQISSRRWIVLHADGIFCAAGTESQLISEGDRG